MILENLRAPRPPRHEGRPLHFPTGPPRGGATATAVGRFCRRPPTAQKGGGGRHRPTFGNSAFLCVVLKSVAESVAGAAAEGCADRRGDGHRRSLLRVRTMVRVFRVPFRLHSCLNRSISKFSISYRCFSFAFQILVFLFVFFYLPFAQQADVSVITKAVCTGPG